PLIHPPRTRGIVGGSQVTENSSQPEAHSHAAPRRRHRRWSNPRHRSATRRAWARRWRRRIRGIKALGPIACIFIPFAVGYFLSYVFRTINAVIAGRLAADLSLDAAQLGLLTSVYFLAFAAIQLPVGAALDHYGPRRVQSILLFLAAVGAALFASASTFPGLMLGRALVGLS